VVVVVLSDSFWWMRAQRNSEDTQQSGHAPKSGPVKDGRSSAKDLIVLVVINHGGGGSSATRSLLMDGTQRNSEDAQQSGHGPRSGREIKDGSSAEDSAPERFRCRTIRKVVSLQLMNNSLLVLEEKRRLWPRQRSRDSSYRRRGKGPVFPSRPRKSGKWNICERDFVCKWSNEIVLKICYD